MIFWFLILLLVSFSIYWLVKFYQVVPLTIRIDYLEKYYIKFDEFVLSIISISNNLYKEEFINLVNMVFIKMNSLFPDTSIYVFEEKDGLWTYVGGVNDLSKTLSFYHIDSILKTTKNDIVFVENGRLFESGTTRFFIIPIINSNRKIYAIVSFEDSDKEVLLHYLKFIVTFLKSIKNHYEIIEQLNNENKKMKMEMDSIVKELEEQGSKLIKKNRETKFVYDSISSFSSDDAQSSVKNLISILHNLIKSSFVVYYSNDELNKLLVPHSYVGKSINYEKYTISLDDYSSFISKSFVNKNLIILREEKDISDKIFIENEIKTALIFPVYSSKNKYGVLVVAFENRKDISKDDFLLVEIILKEISVVVNLLELYNKVSNDAKNLANLNKIKDEFLATVNHEIKTPLTTIKGFVSVILNGEAGPLNEQQQSFLTMVDQATNRLIGIVTNLLDISRLNSELDFELQKENLIDMTTDALIGLRSKAYLKRIKIDFSYDSKDCYVMVDRHWITQVVTNLIDNAIKYSPSNTDILINIYNRGTLIVFSVKDYGYGIGDEDKKYVFEKFYRSKDIVLNTEGSGLGLSISKTIIEKHNGRIWFESQKGKGSTFYFALPKAN